MFDLSFVLVVEILVCLRVLKKRRRVWASVGGRGVSELLEINVVICEF